MLLWYPIPELIVRPNDEVHVFRHHLSLFIDQLIPSPKRSMHYKRPNFLAREAKGRDNAASCTDRLVINWAQELGSRGNADGALCVIKTLDRLVNREQRYFSGEATRVRLETSSRQDCPSRLRVRLTYNVQAQRFSHHKTHHDATSCYSSRNCGRHRQTTTKRWQDAQ
jgi:hypothetical protein